MRSARVDLPWSMCAMMQKFRMIAGSVWPGCGASCWDTRRFLCDDVGRAGLGRAGGGAAIVPRCAGRHDSDDSDIGYPGVTQGSRLDIRYRGEMATPGETVTPGMRDPRRFDVHNDGHDRHRSEPAAPVEAAIAAA